MLAFLVPKKRVAMARLSVCIVCVLLVSADAFGTSLQPAALRPLQQFCSLRSGEAHVPSSITQLLRIADTGWQAGCMRRTTHPAWNFMKMDVAPAVVQAFPTAEAQYEVCLRPGNMQDVCGTSPATDHALWPVISAATP
jgi:hypothetical protein